jgi:uncharacterized NAD(P)/FAD-binding protein YdhS
MPLRLPNSIKNKEQIAGEREPDYPEVPQEQRSVEHAIQVPGIVDAAVVGPGVSGHLVLGHLALARKEVPKEYREDPDHSGRKMNFLMIGEEAGWGGGIAYSKLGYSQDEELNILPHQVAFKAEAPNPIDEEFLKRTGEPETREINLKRPFQFAKSHTNEETGVSYDFSDGSEGKYKTEGYLTNGRFLRRNYGAYVTRSAEGALNESKRVQGQKIHGTAVDIKYDSSQKLFTIFVKSPDREQLIAVKAHNVVLTTGHARPQPVHVLEMIESDQVYFGNDVYSFLRKVRASPKHFKDTSGLIIGSGLTMNDCANTLLPAEVKSFKVISRNTYTHELPQAVPALPELDPVADQIHRLLDPAMIKTDGRNRAESFVRNLKKGFEEAKNVAESYSSKRHDPLIIRRQNFSRERVSRAVLSQYVAFLNESARGDALRDRFGDALAAEIAQLAIKEIDEQNHAWITAVRVSTTDQNIQTNAYLRDNDKFLKGEVNNVVKEGEKFRVILRNKQTMLVDYIVDATGRQQTFENSLVKNSDPLLKGLLADGLLRPDPVLRKGVQIDPTGRAIGNPTLGPSEAQPNLYPVSPYLSKSELMYPANRSRPPLSSTVAESVMGLQPLAKQAAQSIMENITGWAIVQEKDLEYLYEPHGVIRQGREPEDDEKIGSTGAAMPKSLDRFMKRLNMTIRQEYYRYLDRASHDLGRIRGSRLPDLISNKRLNKMLETVGHDASQPIRREHRVPAEARSAIGAVLLQSQDHMSGEQKAELSKIVLGQARGGANVIDGAEKAASRSNLPDGHDRMNARDALLHKEPVRTRSAGR